MHQALSDLFCGLNKLGIPYFLLTDFEGHLTEHDVDLFVQGNSKEIFEKTIYDMGWFKRKEPAYHVNHNFYFSPNCSFILDVKFELSFACGPRQCHTYKYVEEASVRSFLNNKGIRRPFSYDAVMLYAAHIAYLERRKLEGKHKAYLAAYLNEFEQKHSYTPSEIHQVSRWLKEFYPNNQLLQEILYPHFSHSHKRMVRRSHPFKFGWGTKVLFLGTDGAGKSTLINAVKDKLLLKSKDLYLGTGEEGWTSGRMKKIVRGQCSIKLVNKVFSFLKTYLLLPAEFVARIIPVITKAKYSVVLIDRIPGKYFLDKNRSRQLLYKTILPKPDLVFYLYAQPEVLERRKPTEFSFTRCVNDSEKFRKVAEKISQGHFISIDTSYLSIDQASDLILAEIYKNKKIYENILTGKAS